MAEEEIIIKEASGDGASATSHTRRLSLEKDFMNYDTDDLMFGLMLSTATYNPNLKQLYLSKSSYVSDRKLFYSVCDTNNMKTLKRRLDKIKEKGLVIEDDKNYYFPYNVNDRYRIIDKQMLRYLVDTRSKQCIRVYILLLDWYMWKNSTKEHYIFTRGEVAERLGFSKNNSNARLTISNILSSLQKEGIISYREFYQNKIMDNGIEVTIPLIELCYVAKKVDEFKK